MAIGTKRGNNAKYNLKVVKVPASKSTKKGETKVTPKHAEMKQAPKSPVIDADRVKEAAKEIVKLNKGAYKELERY